MTKPKGKEVKINFGAAYDANWLAVGKCRWTAYEVQYALGESTIVRHPHATPWRDVDFTRIAAYQASRNLCANGARRREVNGILTSSDLAELVGAPFPPAPPPGTSQALTDLNVAAKHLPEIYRTFPGDTLHPGAVIDGQWFRALRPGEHRTYLHACTGLHKKGNGADVFETPLDYYSSAEGGMIGVKRWHLLYEGAELLRRFASKNVGTAQAAWGEVGAAVVGTPDRLRSVIAPPWWKTNAPARACMRFSAWRSGWFLKGWEQVARLPEMVLEQVTLALEVGFGLNEDKAREVAGRILLEHEPLKATQL